MPATRLATKRVEKPWGRHDLWPGFDDPAEDAEPIGEIWFETEGDAKPELLIKYLFTSEKLSVQVHPDDAEARAAGYPRGKDEAWLILDAKLDSTIALGTTAPTTREHLREAAEDGSIEGLLDWRPVHKDDSIYSPAGTIHAIGAGLTLIEVQQNVDLTYRLYDYGRPRELHLDAGLKVSDPNPFVAANREEQRGAGRTILAAGPKFVMERWSAGRAVDVPDGQTGWFIPIAGSGTIDGQAWRAGEVWTVTGAGRIDGTVDALFAYPGATVLD